MSGDIPRVSLEEFFVKTLYDYKVWITPYIKDLNIEAGILKEFKVSQNDFNLVDSIGAIIWHEKFPNDFQNFTKIKAISRFGCRIRQYRFKFCLIIIFVLVMSLIMA